MEFLKNLDSDVKSAFNVFCSESWEKSLDLVDRARQRQTSRDTGTGR